MVRRAIRESSSSSPAPVHRVSVVSFESRKPLKLFVCVSASKTDPLNPGLLDCPLCFERVVVSRHRAPERRPDEPPHALTPRSTRQAEAEVGAASSVGGGVRLWFEPIDELLEDGLECGIIGVGVVAYDVDGFAVKVGGLVMIAAGFADHAEAVVAVMDIGEACEQVVGGLFGGVEIAGLDHVDHGVGRFGQFVAFIVWTRCSQVTSRARARHSRRPARARMRAIRRSSADAPGSSTFSVTSQAVARSNSTLGRSVPVRHRA